jgi:AcrR family transcriptional regulator
LAVNRDREAAVPADDPDGASLGEVADRVVPVPGAETRASAAVPTSGKEYASWSGEESDGRAVRAQARREQRRSTILAAAVLVFKDKGYHAASVHDIIDAAQIARGTFYLYFTSKREIFAELAATFLELIRGSVQKISLDPAAGEPLLQMRANFRRVMNTVLEHGDLATIMLRGDAGDTEVRAQLDLFYAQVIALIGQAVRVGHALGFARDADVHIIAVAALAGLKEVLGRMLAARGESGQGPTGDPPGLGSGGDPASPWRMSPERVADELLTFFVRGVFTEAAR